MANNTELKNAIAQVIKTNGNQEITGQVLQNTLNSIISSIGSNATFAGIAIPTTSPGTPDQNVFYFAVQAGTYVNFGGLEIKGGFNIIKNNASGNWVLSNVYELVQELGDSETAVMSQKAVTEALNSVYEALNSVDNDLNGYTEKVKFDDYTKETGCFSDRPEFNPPKGSSYYIPIGDLPPVFNVIGNADYSSLVFFIRSKPNKDWQAPDYANGSSKIYLEPGESYTVDKIPLDAVYLYVRNIDINNHNCIPKIEYEVTSSIVRKSDLALISSNSDINNLVKSLYIKGLSKERLSTINYIALYNRFDCETADGYTDKSNKVYYPYQVITDTNNRNWVEDSLTLLMVANVLSGIILSDSTRVYYATNKHRAMPLFVNEDGTFKDVDGKLGYSDKRRILKTDDDKYYWIGGLHKVNSEIAYVDSDFNFYNDGQEGVIHTSDNYYFINQDSIEVSGTTLHCYISGISIGVNKDSCTNYIRREWSAVTRNELKAEDFISDGFFFLQFNYDKFDNIAPDGFVGRFGTLDNTVIQPNELYVAIKSNYEFIRDEHPTMITQASFGIARGRIDKYGKFVGGKYGYYVTDPLRQFSNSQIRNTGVSGSYLYGYNDASGNIPADSCDSNQFLSVKSLESPYVRMPIGNNSFYYQGHYAMKRSIRNATEKDFQYYFGGVPKTDGTLSDLYRFYDNNKGNGSIGILNHGFRSIICKCTSILTNSSDFNTISFYSTDKLDPEGYISGVQLKMHKLHNDNDWVGRIISCLYSANIPENCKLIVVADGYGKHSKVLLSTDYTIPNTAEIESQAYIDASSALSIPCDNFLKIVQLDAARKFYSVDNIKILIDTMSDAHIGYLCLYVNDTQGFRFALDDMVVSTRFNDYDLSKALGDGGWSPWWKVSEGNDLYLTQSDMDTIIDYARSKNVEVFPAFDMPGHMNAIVSTFTEHMSTKIYDLDISNEESVSFALEIVDKYASYFASKGARFWNMCGDEVQSEITNLQDYANFYNRVFHVAIKYGLIPLVYNDLIKYNGDYSPYINKGCYVLFWGNAKATIDQISQSGYRLINATSKLYRNVTNGDLLVSKDYNVHTNQKADDMTDIHGILFSMWSDNCYTASSGDGGAMFIRDIEENIMEFGKSLSGIKNKNNVSLSVSSFNPKESFTAKSGEMRFVDITMPLNVHISKFLSGMISENSNLVIQSITNLSCKVDSRGRLYNGNIRVWFMNISDADIIVPSQTTVSITYNEL